MGIYAKRQAPIYASFISLVIITPLPRWCEALACGYLSKANFSVPRQLSVAMAAGHVLIQGIPVPPDGAPGLRQEFSAWATNTPETSIQVSLFIRALQKFYDTPYHETLSYFQVAGIHGYPANLPWDNSTPPTHRRDQNHRIYCTHNLMTFPTWHRPYMALFEQTLYNLMVTVIGELDFPNSADKDAWVNESKKWRLPYWDWALPSYEGRVPNLFMPNSVNIRVPAAADGSRPPPENVPNPLYRYQLKVNGVPTKMGDLPDPYKVENVVLQDGTVLPVRVFYSHGSEKPLMVEFQLTLTNSGLNALEPADGVSTRPTQTTGLMVSTTTPEFKRLSAPMTGMV